MSTLLLLDRLLVNLIDLFQPIQALENPRFREMIELVARSKDGNVNIPSRHATRKAIIQKYRAHLLDLKKRLNVRIVPRLLEISTIYL